MYPITLPVDEAITLLVLYTILILVLGFTIAEKESLRAIKRIDHWIDTTQSNDWVSSDMYFNLEKEYIDTIAQYEQYRGIIKAINDCNVKINLEDYKKR